MTIGPNFNDKINPLNKAPLPEPGKTDAKTQPLTNKTSEAALQKLQGERSEGSSLKRRPNPNFVREKIPPSDTTPSTELAKTGLSSVKSTAATTVSTTKDSSSLQKLKEKLNGLEKLKNKLETQIYQTKNGKIDYTKSNYPPEYLNALKKFTEASKDFSYNLDDNKNSELLAKLQEARKVRDTAVSELTKPIKELTKVEKEIEVLQNQINNFSDSKTRPSWSEFLAQQKARRQI